MASRATAGELPSVYTTIDNLPTVNSTFEDELIQLSIPTSPGFASMPLDLLSPITLDIAQPRDDFEAAGRAQSLSPGCAFQIDQIEEDSQQELRTMDSLVEEEQAKPLQESEEWRACELAPGHTYSDEGESEIDSDGPALSGDCYPSDSEAGEDDDGECGEDAEDGLGMDMEEMLVQGEWAVQGAQYLDQQAFEAAWPVPGLHKQKDVDVEVPIAPRKPFPSGLINVSWENVGNPFKTATQSMASNGDISDITQIVCFVVITLHFLAGLATSWCDFLLKVFVFLLEALGRADIAEQIPLRLFTACTYSGVPSYNVTALPVCSACGDVFHVGDGAPIDCPRCSIPLYEALLEPTNLPIPNPTRRVLVPRIRLPFLSISSQLESILRTPGIEEDMDWWRTLSQKQGVY